MIGKHVSQSQLDRWDSKIRLARMKREKDPGMGKPVAVSLVKPRSPGIRSSNRNFRPLIQTA